MAGIVIDNRGLIESEIETWFEKYRVVLPFDKDSGPIETIREQESGWFIEEVVVVVVTAFDPGFTITVGFPAGTSDILASTEVDLTTTAVYKFFPYRESLTAETLNAYFAGVSTGGAGYIFVKI